MRVSLFGSTKRVSELISASKHVERLWSSYWTLLPQYFRIVFCHAEHE